MPAADTANSEKARLVLRARGRFDKRLLEPKRLHVDKIDPVFGLVGQLFPGSNSNSTRKHYRNYTISTHFL